MIIFITLQAPINEEVVAKSYIQEIEKIDKPLFQLNFNELKLNELYQGRKFDEIIKIYKEPKTSEQSFVLAEAFYYKRNYKLSDSIHTYLMNESEEFADYSRITKAWILYRKGLYDESEELLSGKDTLLLALIYFKKGDFAKAYKLSVNLNSAEGLFISGVSAYNLFNFDLALKSFETIYKKYPTSEFAPYALLRIAQIYIRTNFLDDAIKYLKIVVDEYSDFPLRNVALYMLIYNLYNTQNYGMFVNYALLFLESYPDDENTETVKQLFKEVYRNNWEYITVPENYSNYLEGYRNFASKKYAVAVEYYKKFLKENEKRFLFFVNYKDHPFIDDALLELGISLVLLENYDEAISYLKKCKTYECMYQLGVAYYKYGKYKNAIRTLRRLTDRITEPKMLADAYFYIGLSYMKLGNVEKKNEYLKKSLRLYMEAGYEGEADKVRKFLK